MWSYFVAIRNAPPVLGYQAKSPEDALCEILQLVDPSDIINILIWPETMSNGSSSSLGDA